MKIRLHLLRLCVKCPLRAADRIERVLTQLLCEKLRGLVFAGPDHRKPPEIGNAVFKDTVPGCLLHELLHLQKILFEKRTVFCRQNLVSSDALSRLLQTAFRKRQRAFQLLHPVCAPRALFERRKRLICRQRAAQPVFRVLAAAHLVVARKAQADQPPVVPPEAELVCQRLKFCPLLARAVEILKRILEDLQSDGICLSLLCHTEIRRQIAQRAIPAEHRRAESMDRRNLRQMDSRKLALQVPVQGICRKAPGKLGADFAAQLACRRLRIGNNQKLVDICRVVFVLHIGKQPVDQHLRLARACRRTDNQAVSPVLAGVSLISAICLPPFKLLPEFVCADLFHIAHVRLTGVLVTGVLIFAVLTA